MITAVIRHDPVPLRPLSTSTPSSRWRTPPSACPKSSEQADPAKAKRANLLSRAVELGLPALAVTDLNNLFALVKFYKAAEAVGIKPIAGADVMVATPDQAPYKLTLLCRDREG